MPLTHYKSALSICHEREERKGEKKFISRVLDISLAFDRNVSFIQGRPGGGLQRVQGPGLYRGAGKKENEEKR